MAFGDAGSTKGRRFPVEVLTAEEVRGLMAAASRRGSCGLRDRALIATLYRAGLRIAEALALRPKDVDLAAGTVRVLRAKGGKQRLVGVDAETIALIERWIARRTKLGLNGIHPLFCTLGGGTMSRVQVEQHMKALATKAGIEKRVHPHALRHSRAYDMMKNGIAVPIIQRALGHASLSTTATYLNHIAPQDVVDAMKGGSW